MKPDGRKRSTSCSPALPSPKFPRTPTLALDTVHQMVGKFVDDEPQSPRSPVGAAKMAEWLERVAADKSLSDSPLHDGQIEELVKAAPSARSIEANRKVMHFENFEFSRDSSESTTPRNESHQTPSSDTKSPDSAADNGSLINPPTYNLAPQHTSSLDFTKKQRSASDQASLPKAKSNIVNTNSPTLDAFPVPSSKGVGIDMGETSGLKLTSEATRRKNLSIQVIQSFAVSDQLQTPLRSPAVTDAHFATCFGVDQPFHKQSVQIGGESLDFPLTANSLGATSPFVRSPQATGTNALPAAFKKHHIKRQQSMPAIIYRGAAPVSPPPSAPLPAVPNSSSSVDRSLRPGHARGRSVSPMSPPGRTTEPHHARSATIDCLTSKRISPLSSNAPNPTEVRYARRLSSMSIPSKPPSRRPSQNRSSASAIAAVAAQLQKMTSPLPTPSPFIGPATAPVADAQVDSIDSVVSASNDDSLTALPAMKTTEIKGYPFPLVISSVSN